MNTYSKFAANVFVAKCTEQHEKGDVITLTSKYGKETEVIVHNLVKQTADHFFYSFIRADGLNSQDFAERRAERLKGFQANAKARADQFFAAAQESRDFLVLGEPIKIGHHSEKKHRKLFERNDKRMRKCVEETEKADSYNSRISYWEAREGKIDLSMPESIEFFKFKLEQAEAVHLDLKNNPEKRCHCYSLSYAKKDVNELKKKVHLAELLWG